MTSIPEIRTERLILRAPRQSDFAGFSGFYSSDRSSFVGGPLTEEVAWRVLAAEIGHWTLRGYGRWAVEVAETGEFVGIIGLWNPWGWPEPEIGWDLMNGHEGKGYATEAARAAREYAYGTLGWTTAISLVNPKNTGSARVAERLGARPDGTSFTHERYGYHDIWRHPAPEEAA